MLTLSARLPVVPSPAPAGADGYALHGSPDEIQAGIADWAAMG